MTGEAGEPAQPAGPDPTLATPAPALSVVVGARAAEGSPAACLAALAGQWRDDLELVLVEDQPGGDVAGVRVDRRLVVPGGLVPELWAEGIRQASGTLVGLLAGNVVPDPDWVALTIELHKGDRAGIGGAIEPGPGMGLADWAVYFCRYVPYMRPVVGGPGLEVPGDNASYVRDVLARYGELYRKAFSEPFVHKAMRADGHALAVEAARVVRVGGGARAGSFCRQRFLHGREHGQRRAAGQRRGAVLAAAATAPLVPFVMTARAGRQVLAKRRHAGRFAASLPLLLAFYTCWAAGELVGRLAAVAGRPTV